ncbi:MAG: M15 family metallopeptidase [bacterium]
MKLVISITLCIVALSINLLASSPIIDSDMTLKEALKGTKAPADIIEKLELVTVEYYSFDNKLHRGQLVLHDSVVEDLKKVFEMMKEDKFPIAKCIPIVKYDWSDSASMADNNTSAFNYRFVAGTTNLSNHAKGIAIDFNPVQNPAVYNNGDISPKGAKFNPKAKGTITEDSRYTKFLMDNKWRWGGVWTSLKDYQHFDKPF